MKHKFALFAWNSYYPQGGFNDIHSTYETEIAALNASKEKRTDNLDAYVIDEKNIEIVNLETLERIVVLR